jgi:hypothetical protein
MDLIAGNPGGPLNAARMDGDHEVEMETLN